MLVRCPECNFGLPVLETAVEILCPKCGTRVSKVVTTVIQVNHEPVWLSEEQMKAAIEKASLLTAKIMLETGQCRSKNIRAGG